MNRAKRLYILLGVLAAACIAAFAVLHLEQRQEEIAESGETVLEIDPDAVQSLSWEYEGETLAFHRDGDGWRYDDDEAFPVDGEKIQELLGQFEAFGAAFVITDVEDYAQYGLDDPTCTIQLATEEESYTIELGNYSNMDEQRYVSTGDGNVYLAVSDPLDVYDTDLSGLIANDQVPDWTQVTGLTFAGEQDYTVTWQEDSGLSYSEDDVYFTQQDGESLPLDTSLVEGYLRTLQSLELTDYVTYNATDEELAGCGLDEPQLTVTVDYTGEDEDGAETSGTFVLHISRDPEELAQAQADEESGSEETEDTEEEITAYARVGDSQIVYQLSGSDYEALMAASYDELRHQEVLWADFAGVTQLDITLEGEEYTISAEGEGDDRTWTYQGEELEIDDLQSALEGLTAAEFTDEAPDQQEEISLTVHLDSESFPTVEIRLYRYDGTNCLAVVDGESVSLVPREQVVDLTEAVRAIVLN